MPPAVDESPPGSPGSGYKSHVAAENPPSRSLLSGAIPLTNEEANQVHADIYGRKPPGVVRREERLASLEREISCIPPNQRTALDKVRRSNPVAYESSSHTRLLIEAEPFHAADAALRLVRYWERRAAMFGDRAFSDDTFSRPVYTDYLNYYHKCERAIDDPEADDDTKAMSRNFITCVQKVKIESLDRLLDEAPAEEKEALVEAQKRGAGASREHKLLFLQREEFIEQKAAVRMMKFWEMKRRLFGSGNLHRDITFQDINFGHAETSFVRLMPGTDDNQRTIMAIFVNALEEEGWTVENVGRFYWCVVNSALERQSCVKNGLVVMLNYKAGSKDIDEKIGPVRHFCRSMLYDCLPISIRATHVFFEPSSWWQWLLGSIFASVGSVVQKRAVIHLGTDYENRRELQEKFGISPENIPKEVGGDCDLDYWVGWLEDRK